LDTAEFSIRLENVSDANATIFAGELKDRLRRAHQEVQVTPHQQDDSWQAGGSILEIILSARAIPAVITGIINFVKQKPSVKLVIECQSDKNKVQVQVENITSEHAEKLLEKALKSCFQKHR